MDLTQELKNQLSMFVRGELSLSAVHYFVAQYAEELASSPDPEGRKLESLTWGLLSEYSYGHQTEETVRTIIGRELQPVTRRTLVS